MVTEWQKLQTSNNRPQPSSWIPSVFVIWSRSYLASVVERSTIDSSQQVQINVQRVMSADTRLGYLYTVPASPKQRESLQTSSHCHSPVWQTLSGVCLVRPVFPVGWALWESPSLQEESMNTRSGILSDALCWFHLSISAQMPRDTPGDSTPEPCQQLVL